MQEETDSGNSGKNPRKTAADNPFNDFDKALSGFTVEQTIHVRGDSADSAIESSERVAKDGSESFSFDLTISSSASASEADTSATLPSAGNISGYAPEDQTLPSGDNLGGADQSDRTLPSAGSFGGADESAMTMPSEGFSSAPEDQTLPSSSGSGSYGGSKDSGYASSGGTEQTIQVSGSEDRTLASTPGASSHASSRASSRSGSGSYSQSASASHSRPKSVDERHDLSVGGASSISVNIRPRNIISSLTSDTISSDLSPADSLMDMADYEILSKLGEGGMGVVYTARQSSIDRPIALKVVKGTQKVDKRQKARFLLEAIVTGDLDHPNIVPVYDLGKDPVGNIFYAMKQVQGKPWDKEIKNLSLRENLDVLLGTCNAIAFAHSRKVIHRDLKPENIMLGSYGEVLVMDWGLAVSVQQGGKAEPLGAGVGIAGTPAYMAPEMAGKDWKKLGFHSDVYLLGAILYEIVTGKRPHKGRGAMECLKAAARNDIVETDMDNELVQIAMRAMATDPVERPGSVQQFSEQIKEYLSHEDSIRLTKRAAEWLETATKSKDYNDFNAAIFAYREALELWPENEKASTGLAMAILALAQVAYEKGDFDLARSNLHKEDREHQKILALIEKAQAEAEQRKKMLGVLKKAAAVLVLLVIAVSVIGYVMVKSEQAQTIKERNRAQENEKLAIKNEKIAIEQKKEANKQRDLAENRAVVIEKQKKDVETQRDRAVAAEKVAKNEKAKAVKSEQKAVQALADLTVARTRKERAEAQARAQSLLATQRKEQMEKIEKTRENTWWAFKPTQAALLQQQQAKKVKYPLQKTVELPGKMPLVMQFIPAGKFGMGSRTDEPGRRGEEVLHRVELTKPFYMGKYEITRGQWQAVMGGDTVAKDQARLPQANVTWKEVNDKFLPALNRFAPKGWKFALPTEAQWEWASRAGDNGAYNANAPLDKVAWYYQSKVDGAQPVGQKQPNAWGLYDMLGNVAEMCGEVYNEDFYTFSPEKDPVNQQEGAYRVARGGSYVTPAEAVRSAMRNFVHTDNSYKYSGVRVILVPEKQ